MPLTTSQLASTTKMQKLAPYQQKIQAKYANDEQTKNQLLAQLFQAAQVNPLAGCLPALVQIPIFISLYRALQNLIAENKLDEPFLVSHELITHKKNIITSSRFKFDDTLCLTFYLSLVFNHPKKTFSSYIYTTIFIVDPGFRRSSILSTSWRIIRLD